FPSFSSVTVGAISASITLRHFASSRGIFFKRPPMRHRFTPIQLKNEGSSCSTSILLVHQINPPTGTGRDARATGEATPFRLSHRCESVPHRWLISHLHHLWFLSQYRKYHLPFPRPCGTVFPCCID